MPGLPPPAPCEPRILPEIGSPSSPQVRPTLRTLVASCATSREDPPAALHPPHVLRLQASVARVSGDLAGLLEAARRGADVRRDLIVRALQPLPLPEARGNISAPAAHTGSEQEGSRSESNRLVCSKLARAALGSGRGRAGGRGYRDVSCSAGARAVLHQAYARRAGQNVDHDTHDTDQSLGF
ncbi:hypothetical protein C8Q76DRAFT_179739 [Earliella scabrosa]|nr:hypothetical protein C8Q76DRAFT_179739 [Earliella scabrosa]